VTYLSRIIALPFIATTGSLRTLRLWSCCCLRALSLRDLALRHVTTLPCQHRWRARTSSSTALGSDNDLTGTDSTDCTTYCARLRRVEDLASQQHAIQRAKSVLSARRPVFPSHVTLSMFHSWALTLPGEPGSMDTTRRSVVCPNR